MTVSQKTSHGKPAALIIGVESEDFEDLMTRFDPKFWNMIEARRKASKTLSADEMRKRLGVAQKARRKRKRAEPNRPWSSAGPCRSLREPLSALSIFALRAVERGTSG